MLRAVLNIVILQLLLHLSQQSAPAPHDNSSQPDCEHWSYEGGTRSGLESWTTTCVVCAGKEQSPIDIPVSELTYPTDMKMFLPLEIREPNLPTFTMKNTGHSISMKANMAITVTGMGLPGDYYLNNIHWHWGPNKLSGSEHRIGGRAFLMEAHLTLYSTKYSSFVEAEEYKNGAAVIAMLYEDDYVHDNPTYDWIDRLPEMESPGGNISLKMDPNNLLPALRFPYYRYMGSLTTPPCLEGIIWTVFANPVHLSPRQMEKIRSSLKSESGEPMVKILRPPQPRNSRKVSFVDPHTYITFMSNAGNLQAPSNCLVLLALAIFFNYRF